MSLLFVGALLALPALADPARVLVVDADAVTRGALRRIHRTVGDDAVLVPLADALSRYLAIYDALHPDSATWLATRNARQLHRWNRTSSRLEPTSPRCP